LERLLVVSQPLYQLPVPVTAGLPTQHLQLVLVLPCLRAKKFERSLPLARTKTLAVLGMERYIDEK
jgi:hypothetical protein